MAAYAVDQMPAVGNANQLKEAKTNIPSLWKDYLARTRNQLDLDQEASALVAKINGELAGLFVFMDTLEQAYRQEKKSEVTQLLENDWPRMHAGLLKPIASLLKIQEAAVKSTYQKNLQVGRNLLTISGVVVVTIFVLLIYLGIKTINAITRPLNKAVEIAGKIAAGDLSHVIHIETNDEMGELLSALNEMSKSLKLLVGNISAGANQLQGAVHEISVGNNDLSQRTQEEASLLEETAASMEELTTTVRFFSIVGV